MNNYSTLNNEQIESRLAHVGPCEDAPCCGCCGQLDADPEFHNVQSEIEADMQRGFPGDGSGEDDLADHNANEADDYRDEGYGDAGDGYEPNEPEFFGGE